MIRHNGCRGFKLFRFRNYQIELWFCPSEEFIEPHVHNRIDSTIVFLAGEMHGHIADRSGLLKWPYDSFRRFSVPAGVKHWAKIGKFCIFANIERWHGDVTSASEDFTAL